MLGLYLCIVLLFSLPFMQTRLAGWTASLLSKELGAKVEIGSANIGFLNRVIVNDLTIYEPSGKQMASVARASASIEVTSLLYGRIVINAAQLFGANATLYKATPDSEPNYQFIVDALSSNDDKESSPIDLSINSFIMRRTNISYDVLSEPQHEGTFDLNHLALRSCGMNLSLHFVTDDSIECKVKRLQATEANSGLRLQNTLIALSANKNKAIVSAFHIELPNSTFDMDSLCIAYSNDKENKEFAISETQLRASVVPSDLSPLLGKLNSFADRADVAATIYGDNKQIYISDFTASYDGVADCALEARITSLLTDSRAVDAKISRLVLKADGIREFAATANADSTMLQRLAALGDIDYNGTVHASAKNISSTGVLTTAAGNVDYDVVIDEDKQMLCTVNADSVALGRIAGISDIGKASFNITAMVDLATRSKGHVNGDISSLEYKGYRYQDIKVALSNNRQNCTEGKVSIDDDNLAFNADFTFVNAATKHLQLEAEVNRCSLDNLNLAMKHRGETLSLHAIANLAGQDINTLAGTVDVSDFSLVTPTDRYDVEQFCITAEHDEGQSLYAVNSDFLNAVVKGKVRPTELVAAFTNIISYHLPQVVRPSMHTPDAEFDYDLTLRDCALLRYITDMDMSLDKPLTVCGTVNTLMSTMAMTLNAPAAQYDGTTYNDVHVVCNASPLKLNTNVRAHSYKDEDDGTPEIMSLDIEANAYKGVINSYVDVMMQDENTMAAHLKPTITLSDSIGKLKTNIALKESTVVINDTVWTINPATISIHDKEIACHGLNCVSSAGSSISVDGAASASQRDSLVAQLNDVEIKYILEAVGFDAVRFAGKASGHATLRGLMDKEQGLDFNASLHVKDFTLQEGSFGEADIQAKWNKQNEAIDLTADFVDRFLVPVDLTNETEEVIGRTKLVGWISPAKNDMRLDVMTDNTNAAFLHGFLGGVFTEMNGTISGPIAIVGLKPVNLIGNAAANLSFRLRATNVPYQIKGDTVRLSEDLIALPDVTLYDKYGNRGAMQATIRHHNMKNFQYSIHCDMDGLCAYDETQFNSDKFYATVFTRGTVDVNGSDGHPLRINADITPTRGSVFAYDAATPDAITSSSFVEFADRENDIKDLKDLNVLKGSKDLKSPASHSSFTNDIYFNANIHLTPDCEVKLRMDNIDDGYMRTYGYADLNAQWHNKGSFQLFGNYDIQGGSYRLYLQNLIFRDLALQSASSVEFNGNPFDAAIHLVCNHTINSVPVSDLTSTKAFSQNNKVKVNCILDITGFLEKMDFKFDMELLNVNDEVRQLVRAMINSEEEMNTQMIYLLGFGRFYPTEYARNSGNNNSEQAVNSLLSSTISGQINQLLSNMIGQNSNWTFGSTLATGENGWEDLDVEGNVSGRLLNERLLVNGNFGYRDNAMTNQANFIGDFEVKYKLTERGNVYVKAYNQANDRYFTKATLNTQGLGLSWQLDFDHLFPKRRLQLMPAPTLRRKNE